MLSVVMLKVVAPVFTPQQTKLSIENFWELKIEINNPGTWALCCKTFCVRNLRMLIKGTVLIPGKPFQPSLMFSSKAGAYLSEAPFRLLALPTKIKADKQTDK
jgi:hypothetical protein